MSITKWQPFGDLLNMYDRVNRLFEDELLGDPRRRDLAINGWAPLTDIYETKDAFVFKVELPGFAKEDIKVEFNGDILTIRGERKQEKEINKEDCHRIERHYGIFQRSFSLPKNADTRKIEATLTDGILQLNIPKVEETQTKAIPINVK